MANSITTRAQVKSKPRPVRSLPAWQISERLRKRGVRQWDIAKTVGRSQAYVSDVINRRRRTGPGVEPIWRAVEEALA